MHQPTIQHSSTSANLFIHLARPLFWTGVLPPCSQSWQSIPN